MIEENSDRKKRDTDPCQPSARDRAFLLLEEDPELYQAVLDLEHEICCKEFVTSTKILHSADCPYSKQ